MAQRSSKSSISLKALFPNEDVREFGETQIQNLCLDSRVVEAGDCFVALPGDNTDGRGFISMAIERGAATVLCESDGERFSVSANDSVVQVSVPHLRDRLSAIAGNLFGHPSEKLTLVGITGTNGKTTCSQWLAQVLHRLGSVSASVGTLGYGICSEELIYNGMTTPDAIEFQKILAKLLQQGASAVVAEVSSHGLALGRVADLNFDVAVVTNISRDHLDFHGDEARYVAAKRELMKFPGLRGVVLNKDDAYFAEFESAASAPVVTVSLTECSADYYCSQIKQSAEGMCAMLHTPSGQFELKLGIWGEFNLYNILSVVAAAHLCGHPIDNIVACLSELPAVAGRMEPVAVSTDISVLVDFAHTPDALRAVLSALRQHTGQSQKVWCVFGCGGDRDRGKRPQMAEIAEQNADAVVITSDNPRSENAQQIIEDIKAGLVDASRANVIEDRASAIGYAIVNAAAGDIVLLAGKGHENYQLIGDEKLPFSDFRCAEMALKQRVGGVCD